MEKMILFSERQRWPWFVYLPLVIIVGVFIFGMYTQLVLNRPFGQQPAGDTVLIVISVFVVALTLFMFIMRLETRIEKDGVYVRMFPIHRQFKKYEWQEISKAYLRDYHPILEYGGWGIRGFGDDKAFNMRGKTGLQLILANGKKLLIGTCKKEEVTKALSTLNN